MRYSRLLSNRVSVKSAENFQGTYFLIRSMKPLKGGNKTNKVESQTFRCVILVDTLTSPVLNDFRYCSIALSDVSEGIRLRIGFIVTRASLIS